LDLVELLCKHHHLWFWHPLLREGGRSGLLGRGCLGNRD
jgi:hypothetical protein